MTQTATVPKRRGRPPKVQIEEHGDAPEVETEAERIEAEASLREDEQAVAPRDEADGGQDSTRDVEEPLRPAADPATGRDASETDRGDEEVDLGDAPVLTLAEPWATMETAPKGGKPVWLMGVAELPCGLRIPVYQGAFLYTTRHRERAPMRWVEAEWWATLPRGGVRMPVPFEPVAWQRYN